MYSKVCPVCQKKFYTENNYFMDDSALHNYCNVNKDLKKKNKQRPARTSTPISDLESSPSSILSDSVSEFFYQSWKSGIHPYESQTNQMPDNRWNCQLYPVLQPVCYAPQVVYINTVILPAYVPISYMHQVGHGSFGIFSTLWRNNVN